MADGFVARKLHSESDAGAKLDSAADVLFALAIAVFAAKSNLVPLWLWWCAAGIALLRCTGYLIGWRKYRTFTAIHTYANKITGALLVAAPLLIHIAGITAAGVVFCAAALVSTIEEIIIVTACKKLDRDCRSALTM